MIYSLLRSWISCLFFLSILTSCSYNPFNSSDTLTGNAIGPVVGAAAGAGTAMALGNSSHVVIGLAGLSGAALGYYVTTLYFASGGINQAGGQVFTVGDYVTIEIPSDRLFEIDTDEFLPDASPILDSVVSVLNRYPYHNIMISGNTSGFSSSHYEYKLSENRARQVSSYLWAHGISELTGPNRDSRKLNYVGYGNYFPIANDLHNDSIRQNSRIQITAYPTDSQLHPCHPGGEFSNIGALREPPLAEKKPIYKGEDETKESIDSQTRSGFTRVKQGASVGPKGGYKGE